MSRDSYYNQLFRCKKCRKNTKQYTWMSEIDKNKCEACNSTLVPLFNETDKAPEYIIKSKHAKGRLPAEREKRRIDDFKKNTLPTLPRGDRAYFEKKFNMKKST